MTSTDQQLRLLNWSGPAQTFSFHWPEQYDTQAGLSIIGRREGEKVAERGGDRTHINIEFD